MILLCLALPFTFSSVVAAENGDLETIYHVYIDGKHIGKVDTKETVQTVIEDKLANNTNDDGLTRAIQQDISYVSEKAFHPTVQNREVTEVLEDTLTTGIEAVELHVDNQIVGYFKDQETAEKVLFNYKAKYVDKEVLEEVESRRKTDTILDIDESQIKDVTLSEDVSFSTEKVNQEELLSVKQGVKILEKGTLEEKVHHVAEGEVLGEIADQYDLSTKKLLELNPSVTEESVLQINQEINVTDTEPFAEVILIEEKRTEEAIPYDTEVIESDELYKGEEEVQQKGKKGKRDVLYSIKKQNGTIIDQEVLDETILKDPVKEVIIKGTKVIPSRGTGSLSWPAVGGYISSHVGERWGSTHKGIDIARPSNRNILAADNGVVESAGYDSGGYGNKIVINHNNGMKTIYAHLQSIDVKVGQTVEKGSKIGVMGSTGNSTGIHLHFEVYKNGALENPTNYF